MERQRYNRLMVALAEKKELAHGSLSRWATTYVDV